MTDFENQKKKESLILDREPREGEFLLGYAYDTERTDRDVWVLKGISQEDRAVHFYVVGASGRGKTKFLEYMIAQDIKNREGFGIIDPHGDLIEEIKARLALSGGNDLDERVLLIDPTDENNSVCFNPLELTEGMKVTELAGELVLVFKKIWDDSWGARMADIFRNTLIALIENGRTLDEVPRFLTDSAFRGKLVEKVKNEMCREFFQTEFDVLSQRARGEQITSTTDKVRALLADERVRQIFTSPKSSFNFREMMDSGKIILVKLDKGRLKDASDFLGSLILSKIQMAAFSRTDIKKRENRKRFYLYIDEFQNFAADSFKLTLSEATKYGLSLIIAHQNLAQLTPDLRASVLGNCWMQAYFHVSRLDADLLAKEAYAGVFAEPQGWETYIQELQTLPPRVCIVKHSGIGGIIRIEIPPIRPAWEEAGLSEEEFDALILEKNIGGRYLQKREDIEREHQTRRKAFGKSDEPEGYWRK